MRHISVAVSVVPFMPLLYLAASVAFADVSVRGLERDAKTNVQLTLSLAKEKCDAPAWKIRRLFEQADAEISQALRALGYYR
ncbi:MAG: POTRA domain-containing protein, partial [Gammaproteobacteria bacterium]